MVEELYRFNENDCYVCIQNSFRLLKDAHLNGLSGPTQSALVELSVEEASKAFLIFGKVVMPGFLDMLGVNDVDKKIVLSFERHHVKIKAIKAFYKHYVEIMKNQREDEYAMNMAKELWSKPGTKVKSEKELYEKFIENNIGSFKDGLAEFIAKIMDLSVNKFEKIKELGFYVNLDQKDGTYGPVAMESIFINFLSRLTLSLLGFMCSRIHCKELKQQIYDLSHEIPYF